MPTSQLPWSNRARAAAGRLVGIHASTVCPMMEDYAVDEVKLADHMGFVAGRPGIEGLLINGHAGENAQLSRSEKRRVIEIAREVAPADFFVTSGVYSESALDAAQQARDAEDAGADAVLVFPPNSWALGQDPDVVLAYHRVVAAASALPLLIYQSPVHAGRLGYPPATMGRLVELPEAAGIKEGSWEIAAYEEVRRLAKAIRPDLSVMASGDEHLLVGYLIGTEGSQVSLAAIVPDQVVALWRAARAGDWRGARSIHDRIYALAVAIYRTPPGSRATARMKACLHILGRLPATVVRPPIQPLQASEYRQLEVALEAVLVSSA